MYKIETVELEITNLCSHRCPYCYVGDQVENQHYFSDYDTVCKVIDNLGEYGVKTIALLGGDPVRHPRIIDIMKYIKKNTSAEVSIMSNTLDFGRLSEEEIAKIADNFDFTLHGASAQEHESFCGCKKGDYDQAIKSLAKYVKLGINVNIAINIIPQTYNKIYDMVKSMLDAGVRFNTLLLQRILPVGKACNKYEFDITKKQIEEAMSQIERAEKDFGIGVSFEDPYPLCYVDPKYHHYFRGCPEGVSRLPVRGDGMISSCGASGDRTHGNILTDSYEDIWLNNKRYELFRTGAFLLNERCKDCTLKEKCRGGCPIRYMMSEQDEGNFWSKFEDE